MEYGLAELEAIETLSVGQSDDLKLDTQTTRVWLSRCTIADGMPYNNQVTIENFINDRWVTVHQYEAT